MKNQIRRFFSVLLCVVLVLTLFPADGAQAAGKVKLNKTSATLYAGDPLWLSVSGTSKQVSWSSSNRKVAAVNKNGVVTANRKGTAQITASVGGKKYTCKVTVRNKTYAFEDDYNRAFWMDYVDRSYQSKSKTAQVTSTEYRSMLRRMITQKGGKLSYFDKKVKSYKKKLTRGDAIVMSYYAAVAIGADEYNYDPGAEIWEDEDFMVYSSDIKKLCPDFGKKDTSENHWENELSAAYFWNTWHAAIYTEYSQDMIFTGQQVVAYDWVNRSIRNKDPFTTEMAVCAVTRLADSVEKDEYISATSSQAVHADKNILSSDLLTQAKKTKVKTLEDLPRLTGFVLDGGSGDTIRHNANDVHNISKWGFSSIMQDITYETIFSDDLKKVNLTELKKLDEMVAASVYYGVHMNLRLTTVPGRTIVRSADGFDVLKADLDLFVNEKKQKQYEKVWAFLATRYQDVPGAYLSFTPFFEATNPNLSSGLAAPEYTQEDIVNTLDKGIAAIRAVDPDRFILYEATSNNDLELAVGESTLAYETIGKKYDNTRITYNFCEMPYVYAGMPADDGADIDNEGHSMFLTDYPVTYYAAKNSFSDGEPLTLDGCLPKGTKIQLYLSESSADNEVSLDADGTVLYNEKLGEQQYQVGGKLSIYHTYAESNKKISVTLEKDTKKLTIASKNGWTGWSGLKVVLPKSYEVERWYLKSRYDAYLDGSNEDGVFLKKTSTLLIGPNSDQGSHITIGKDVTWKSESVWLESSKKTIGAWGGAIHDFSGTAQVRFENGCFSNTTWKSLSAYYEDLLSMFDHYGYGWYSNDYDVMLFRTDLAMKGGKTQKYQHYDQFNMALLKLLQKHAKN